MNRQQRVQDAQQWEYAAKIRRQRHSEPFFFMRRWFFPKATLESRQFRRSVQDGHRKFIYDSNKCKLRSRDSCKNQKYKKGNRRVCRRMLMLLRMWSFRRAYDRRIGRRGTRVLTPGRHRQVRRRLGGLNGLQYMDLRASPLMPTTHGSLAKRTGKSTSSSWKQCQNS